MYIIKLNAIDSTNTFLKDLLRTSEVKNYTVVTANSQLNGRGQAGCIWESEAGKNLIFSIFVKHKSFLLSHGEYLNFVVSLAIFNALNTYNIPNLSIKWPNDILSASKKICGLLIENNINSSQIKNSVIGVGLNVNQENFSNNLVLASSIKNILGKYIDMDMLLEKVCTEIQKEIEICTPNNFAEIKERYLTVLYKYLVPTMFEKNNGTIFMGKIVDVDNLGRLVIELEDERKLSFGLKEVKIIR